MLNLEADTTLGLLITTKFERLAALQDELMLMLANGTFQTQDNLFGSLGLLVENGLSLTTITGLLTIVTTLTLSEDGGFTGLVLGDLVGSVTTTLLTSTKGLTSLRDVDLLKVMEDMGYNSNMEEYRNDYIRKSKLCSWNIQIRIKSTKYINL